jgi:hypothetical protein
MNKEILKRIRSTYPGKDLVVHQSTPVLSFGNFQNAGVFTLGINPSNLEFLDKKGELLKNQLRRLQTLSSLKASDCTSLTQEQSMKVFDGCVEYFNRRPYNWFDKFGPILEAIGHSFNSPPFVAHVDLVQWATKTKWGKIPSGEQKMLIEEGRPFLKYQLQSENLHTILLNGRTVIDAFNDWSNVKLEYSSLNIPIGGELVTGFYDNRVRIIGWSFNIQSSWGVTSEDISQLASIVQEIRKHIP